MLTSEQSKLRLRVIIIHIIIAVLCLIGAIIIIIIAQDNGFSGNNSITCATGTQSYFLSKYTAYDNGLRVSFIGAIFAFIFGMAIMILLGPRLVKINKLPENEVEGQTHQIIENITSATYILVSLCLLTNMIPLAYYGSLVIQASNKCLSSLNINWLIVGALAAIGEILFLICLIIVIRMRVLMETQEGKKESVNDKNENLIEGEIVNQENQKKTPLLDKQNQQNNPRVEIELPTITQQRPSRFANQQQHQQTKNNKPHPVPNTPTFNPQQIQQNKSQRQLEKPQPILPPLNTTSITPQNSKVQIKPQASQNVTHINFNFPTNFPVAQPIVNQPDSSSNDRIYHKSSSKKIKHQKEKREVIKQSMEEELSSDSDDHYYKRARKTKKRRFDFKQDEIGKGNNNRKSNEVDYERQFERIPSRFQESPSEPRYVVLSPQSIQTFYQFVKNDQHSKNKTRDFSKPQHSRRHQKKHKRHQQAGTNHLRPTNNIVMSQVKQFPHQTHLHQSYTKRQELKEKSIYEKLDVGNETDEGNMKKYQKFFRSSRQLNQYEPPSQKNSELDDYFNLLNSNSGNKYGEANYRSISNYSSVLNEQAKGKMPIQREQQNYHNRINLEDNRIRSIKKNNKEKKDILAQIRNKYT